MFLLHFVSAVQTEQLSWSMTMPRPVAVNSFETPLL